ncbi:MAG TPA: lysophospholipid acyltransferase family protein [Verrucomicrobiae bacterium]|nr:lysophospholipid acyltransferase family protein [Verrucomicrobiae bacterium]
MPHRPSWKGELGALAAWMIGSSLARTWRVQVQDESGCLTEKAEKGGPPLIVAIWHNRLASAMTVWRWAGPYRPCAGLAALISASRDGGFLARTFERFGVRPVRGSSSRRGAQALLELTSVIEANYHVAITPDGPRGPKYVVQPGIIALAQLCGIQILPIGVFAHGKKELRSWDNFQVPLPFTRCDIHLGPLISVPREASEGEREAARLQLETELKRLNRD